MLKHFLTVENGLSHNEVTSIVQDNDGFIWIGTRGGLNRYDGYEFKVFNQVPGDTNSLVNPSVEKLFVDKSGNIWIGTKSGGVSKYNPDTGVFKNVVSNYKQKSKLLPDNRILCFHEDQKGQIWMGTAERGLLVYNQENDTTIQFLDNSKVNSIVETGSGDLWVGTGTGLFKSRNEENNFQFIVGGNFLNIIVDNKRNLLWMVGGNSTGLRRLDLRNNTLTSFLINSSSEFIGSASYTYESLLLDNNGQIWVGTWGYGFYLFNIHSKRFERVSINPENRAAINKDYDAVLDIFQDRNNNIWLGTNGGGVVVLTEKLNFGYVKHHPEANKGLINTRIMSVLDDSNGNLWMGTIGSGLFWSPDRENYYQVKNNSFNDDRFFIIKYLYEDHSGKVWVGTNNETFLIEFSNGEPVMVSTSEKYNNLDFRRQHVSFLDAHDMFWLGSLQEGLRLVDKNNYQTIKTINTSNHLTLNSNRISFLLNDSKNRVWIGTYNGLHVYNSTDTTVQIAEDFFRIDGEVTGNIITCLHEDHKGNIWMGTPNGLNKLVQNSDSTFEVEYYTEKNGLASNFIKGIAHDENGNIWFSTNIGISKLITDEEEIRVVNFNETDGVNGKNFTEASACVNLKNEIFFGGASGLTYFKPEEITEHAETNAPVYTSLSVLNQTVEVGKKYKSNIILNKALTHTEKIKLSYKQNKIELRFSAFDFKSGGKNQYAYLLENHDKDWNNIGTRRFVVFNNLKPGEYTLRVKSSNRHNVWSEEQATLQIEITPPLWQTWYALFFYIIIMIVIVSVIRWNAIKQVRLANNLEMEKYQHEQDQKINEMKLRFFTNLSHEFRTPLTLILAPLKELLGKKEDYQLTSETENKISIARNNSLRLMKLVNQLLDFRKVESGNMELHTMETNISEFVSEVCHSFSELAKINNILFKQNLARIPENIYIDRDKFEVILNNIISNAFKNLSENGKIEVAVFEEEEEVLLSVSDNGPGIPETELNNIFDRFYRIENKSGNGSGIGLALVKRFVELHKGTISVVSKPNERTEFTVSLLKGTKHLKPTEIIRYEKSETEMKRAENIFSNVIPFVPKNSSKAGEQILIVEDNPDVNAYLISLLEPYYRVDSATNGKQGYEKATRNIPHLIISDVMMPEMDGFEFCKKIRENETTSTVPFIFLTAKDDEKFRLLGAQLGADDFLLKPFDPNLLLEKLRNILKRREKVRAKYSKSIRLEPSDIEISRFDEVFIERIIETIEENLQNGKFNSDVLASEMNMSNSSLYRRLKNLTGSSTAEFIRSIRIKRSAQLLAYKEKTISEIAYEVGFNDVKHFRTVFQKHFSCSPSEYRQKLV